MNKVYYAIGDIHGQLEQLIALHQNIAEYHQQRYFSQSKAIVHLGDYIDRGEDSCGVIEYLMQQQSSDDTTYIHLKGNHENLMLEAYFSTKSAAYVGWLINGGEATLSSYQKRSYQQPPEQHFEWLKSLPTQYIDREQKLVFVHAGIDPFKFPYGSDKTHMWTRSQAFFDSTTWNNPALEGVRVVHGHTPTGDSQPEISDDGRRINVDTGAVKGGKLTAAVISPQSVEFLVA